MYILTLKDNYDLAKIKKQATGYSEVNTVRAASQRGDAEAFTVAFSGKRNDRETKVKNRASIFMFHVLPHSFSLQ